MGRVAELGSLVPMEVAGDTCIVCGQHIVLRREGKSCPSCGIVVHQECDTRSTCTRCGGEYEIPEPPVVDITRDAILPRRLRPSRTISAIGMVILAVLLMLLALLLLSVRWIC